GSDGLRVLHQLTNSLPWTQSGYALRSHQILRALQAEGIQVGALTRLGYPVVVGRLGAGEIDVVDGVPYHRALPSRMPRGLDARLHLQAEYLADLARSTGAQVLHTTTPYDNSLIAEAAARS